MPRLPKWSIQTLSKPGTHGSATAKFSTTWFPVGDGFFRCAPKRRLVWPSLLIFCSQNWVPLILVRDNAGENVGGSLMKELLSRNVESAFIYLSSSSATKLCGGLHWPHHGDGVFWNGLLGRASFHVDLFGEGRYFRQQHRG